MKHLISTLLTPALWTLILATNAMAQTTPQADSGFLPAETIPGVYRALLPEDLQAKLDATDNPRNPVPTDSDHLIFIIDTSGSMFNYTWEQTLAQFSLILSQYPDLQAFQVLNDMGEYLIPESEGEWINATESEIATVLENLIDFNSFSNSNPEEGITYAINTFYAPDKNISIFVIGDEYPPSNNPSPAELANTLSSLSPDIRIHTKMFPTYFTQPERYRITSYRFLEAMTEVAARTQGSFELLE